MRNLPETHQTLLFSATMPVEIEALAKVRFPSISRPEFYLTWLFSPLSHAKIMQWCYSDILK